MKKFVLLLLSILLVGCTTSYVRFTYSKTAKIKSGYRLGIALGSNLSDALGTELLHYGFTVVERARMDAVLSELQLNSTGALLPENLKNVGKILSVDALVFVTAEQDTESPNTIGSAAVKLVDVESGILIAGVNYQNCDNSKSKYGKTGVREPLPKTARKIARALYKAVKKIQKNPR